jgi:murein DD-endopeptidase MepM/ murein hydrolase activator NlpD
LKSSNDAKLVLFRPVPKDFPISSPFGKTRIIDGKINVHKGIDFACPVGTPVHAVAEGEVFRSGWENPEDPKHGFGLRVMQRVTILDVDYFIFYGHLNELRCEVEQVLKVGQLVGLSGHTGRSTGPHLHLGCRQADTSEWKDMQFFTTWGDEAA